MQTEAVDKCANIKFAIDECYSIFTFIIDSQIPTMWMGRAGRKNNDTMYILIINIYTIANCSNVHKLKSLMFDNSNVQLTYAGAFGFD